MSAQRNGRPSQPRLRPKAQAEKTEVGYGRPPQEHQFKRGQSGNPKGRPKGSKNESTILREILEHKIDKRSAAGTKKSRSSREFFCASLTMRSKAR